MNTVDSNKLLEIANRIKEMREIFNYSTLDMANLTEVSLKEYETYERGELDFPFTFIHKCSQVFGISITELLEGTTAHLSSYTLTRKGMGQQTAKEDGIEISNLAPFFRKKIAEPYYVKYEYNADLLNKPIHLTNHSGQEFDMVIKGKLRVKVGDNVEDLEEGDSIYYNSSTPHGMIAIGGEDCTFLAIILPGEKIQETEIRNTILTSNTKKHKLVAEKFIKIEENEKGYPTSINFNNEDNFNFAYDIVDEIAKLQPSKLALLHVNENGEENRLTFSDIKKESNKCANYFRSLGIEKGDKVMLVLKRSIYFWISIIALHKIGAVAIPATHLLKQHDYEYRFTSANVKAIITNLNDELMNEVDNAINVTNTVKIKLMVNGEREGWKNLAKDYMLFSSHLELPYKPCGDDTMIMFFTSGTSGYPKIAAHSYKYALGHYITAKYWHGVYEDGLHFTISDTGWGKALWGKLYGQWLSEGAVFVYEFEKFDASKILPLFSKYGITTFCAPPTMLRMLIKEDLSKYDLSSIKHMTTAGEALNPEVYRQFEKATGLQIMEGYGQTETTLTIGNLLGGSHKLGSMGKPSPLFDVNIMDSEGNILPNGETGEIVIKTSDKVPCGLFQGYYNDEDRTKDVWYDGYYHTGDTAWRDEDGFYWYVGRVDDVIKSSGYRIGPFEIESVIMELPYVLECGVSAAPDEVRGQVVKASIVLVKGKEGTEELKKEIQEYVKVHTAPYKYPRIVEFKTELPKTISGKIKRNML